MVVRDPEVPPSVAEYGDYREYLRIDFWFSCAYCTITEIEATSIRFVIDHYKPKSKFPDLVSFYPNLMWCCDRCNTFKGNDFVTPKMSKAGFEIFRPDKHHFEEHFELKGVRIESKSPVGEYTTELLDLNRQQLRRVRKIRKDMQFSSGQIVAGLRALLSARIDQLPPPIRNEFVALRNQIQSQQLEARELLEKVLQTWSRSHNLDPDDEAKERTKDRRKSLERMRAIAPRED